MLNAWIADKQLDESLAIISESSVIVKVSVPREIPVRRLEGQSLDPPSLKRRMGFLGTRRILPTCPCAAY